MADSLTEQLTNFDKKLNTTANDVEMLAGIRQGIHRLLEASGSNEAAIRHVLQQQYANGGLRKETLELVSSIVDSYTTENMPTSTDKEAASEPLASAPKAPGPESIDFDSPAANQDSLKTVIPADKKAQPTSASEMQIGSLLRDRYLLQEENSGGGMGVVFKAIDQQPTESDGSGNFVAIKILSPKLAENSQALRSLQQEAAKGRCLVHPNIVKFIDLDRDDNLYFLVMEWLEGRTLADLLDSKDASMIDIKTAFRTIRQIGSALDYAHSRGIVHADVKPGNIMMLPNGDAKLFDFGVARMRQEHPDSGFDEGVLEAITPAYSSMQVLTGDEPAVEDDVFSLCCLLYRLIAGYRVFGPRNAAEASEEGMKPQRLNGLNDKQWSAVKKGLSNSRVTRFSSVREFIDALGVNEEEIPPAVVPDPVEQLDDASTPDTGSSAGKWVVAVVLLVGLAAGAAYQFGFFDTQTAPGTVQNDTSDLASVAAQTEAEGSEPAIVSSDSAGESDQAQSAEGPQAEEIRLTGSGSNLVDFSTLTPPTDVIPFSPGGGNVKPVNIAVREDGPTVIIDFVRDNGLSEPLTLRLEEIGFSGELSPWATGEYALSDSGLVYFPAGQTHGRISVLLASDGIHEADQESTLRLRDASRADSELAIINLTLEDDDRRVYEARLPQNTVTFVSTKATASESDAAVEIDLVRLNPDESAFEVSFVISDLSANGGQDYVGPTEHTIVFGAGERSARLLVPLVQDTKAEEDESFVVELVNDADSLNPGFDQQVVVTIRDDDRRTR